VAGARECRANSAAVRPMLAAEWPISGNEGSAARVNSFMACLRSREFGRVWDPIGAIWDPFAGDKAMQGPVFGPNLLR
jgi:hypothetical protein